jgi:hypothetical protein
LVEASSLRGVKSLASFHGFVRRLIAGFSIADLDYAFTGALAASFYGVPRTTTDIDVIVAVSGEENLTDKVASALQHAGLESEERCINIALESGYRIASFRDKGSPYTLDVIFVNSLKKNAGTVAGLTTFFQAPDDLVLAKLRMIKATKPRKRAVKDEEDVKAILEFTDINMETLKKQAQTEGTLAILNELVT